MADDIIQRIKNIAHEVSEGYLLFDKDMNEAITLRLNNGDIDNKEMLKRICEHANQNVYLAKFQDSQNRGNITFKLADYNDIKQSIDESENAMELYDKPPEDFRSSLEMAVEKIINDNSEEKTAEAQIDALYILNEYKQVFVKLANAAEILKTEASNEVESNFNLIFHDAKRMVANGESLGDISKIASRCVVEDGLDPQPIMKTYGIIEKEMSDSGFSVDTEFTKLSSMRINHSSLMLRPVKSMSMALEKIAAFEEMFNNINGIVKTIEDFVRKHGSK